MPISLTQFRGKGYALAPSIETNTLSDDFAGTGQVLSGGNKERVNFGKVIGLYFDDKTGTYQPTTNGIIHYDKKGTAHIVPSKPKKERS